LTSQLDKLIQQSIVSSSSIARPIAETRTDQNIAIHSICLSDLRDPPISLSHLCDSLRASPGYTPTVPYDPCSAPHRFSSSLTRATSVRHVSGQCSLCRVHPEQILRVHPLVPHNTGREILTDISVCFVINLEPMTLII